MTKMRALSLFTLAMINVATIGSVKNWPITAEYGLASIFFLLAAALLFFIPTALVSAELATGWPERGGVFVWVKEAFGHRTGFLAIWLLWIQNVVWYPTILTFIVSTFAYVFDPALADNKIYTTLVALALFWLTTFINLLGMKTSGWISSVGTVLGTFVPAVFIIALGSAWFFSGKPLQIPLDWKSALPDMHHVEYLVFFAGIIMSLMGIEMSAVHAKDVINPQRSYPRAILLSIIIILGLSIPGVLAIAFVVPQAEINLLSGSIQGFTRVVSSFNLSWLTPWVAALIAVGAIASMSTWLVGPSKGLLAAAQVGDLPRFFHKLNKREMPSHLLIFQALIVSLLTLLFVLMPTVNSAFWFISAVVAQLYLIMYFLLFAAAVKLRYKRPDTPRAYKVPGGKWGIWIVSGIGTLTAAFAMFVGFFPPTQAKTANPLVYVLALLGVVLMFCLGPYFILLFKTRKWSEK
ncbi:MAG: amino acid permease [Chlamydiales bacterium]